jgi:hypothetical protein
MPNTPVLVNGATVKISFGTVSQATGGATAVPTAPTVSYTCYAKSFKASIGSQTIDLSTLCSNIDAVFETRKSGTVDIELYVDKVDGPIFRDKVGFLCKILVDLTTTTGGTFTYAGLVTDQSISLDPNNVEMESATIKLGAFGLTTISG